MRDLGELAECFFRVWCSSIGLIANGSKIDRTGWDFFVEFPLEKDESIAKDMLPSPIECKVQVKGTDKKNRKVAVSLSNLNLLIKAQLPAFYCLIEFGGRNEPQGAFLKHVDKSLIEKTLKRIRELEFIKGDRRLNKHTMNINFGASERLNAPFPESLKKAIEINVSDGMDQYIENKNQLLKTLGFEEGSYRIRFTTVGEEKLKQIFDMSLGLRDKVDVDTFECHQVRFGISSDKPVFYGEKGILSFGDIPASKAIIKFKEYDFSPSLSFEAHAYFSPFANLIPEEFIKVRFESQYFQMVIEPTTKTIQYSFSLANEGRSSLKGLRDILKVLNLFKKSSDGLILEIEFESKSIPLFSLRIFANENVEDWSGGYKIAEMAVSICHRFGISDNDVFVNIEDLNKSSGSIFGFYNAINADPRNIVLSFGAEKEIVQGKMAFILPFISTNIGSHTFGCLVALVGLPIHLGEKQYKLNPDQLNIGSLMIKKDGNFTEQDLDNKLIDYTKKFSENGIKSMIASDPDQSGVWPSAFKKVRD